MTFIITHRGITSEGQHTYTESSREAFAHFLTGGYGLEFDLQVTRDNVPVISHDTSLARLTSSAAAPEIATLTVDEFLAVPLPNGHTVTLDGLVELLRNASTTPPRFHALHLKHNNQVKEARETLLPHLLSLSDLPIIIFDVKLNTARWLRENAPGLTLGASVAHAFDIARYNTAVGGTLLSVEQVLLHREIYDWVWLDEWDRVGEGGISKTLYNEETFSILRNAGFHLAVVSPELHATSPNLHGGEAHQDAQDFDTLIARWKEIAILKPNAICTDYPRAVASYFTL